MVNEAHGFRHAHLSIVIHHSEAAVNGTPPTRYSTSSSEHTTPRSAAGMLFNDHRHHNRHPARDIPLSADVRHPKSPDEKSLTPPPSNPQPHSAAAVFSNVHPQLRLIPPNRPAPIQAAGPNVQGSLDAKTGTPPPNDRQNP